MELVAGVPLRPGKLPLDVQLERFLQLLSVVHYIHRCGYLHLDIKPDNVLVGDSGIKLIDLGSARRIGSGPGEAGGTLGYAAPEILLGQAPSVASDLYSLGAVFYELLSGHQPFSLAEPEHLRQAILDGELAPVRALKPTIPRELARLAESLLATDVNQRPDSLVAVAEEILRLGGDKAAWRPRSGSPLFVGRDAELARVLSLLGPAWISVVGERGSGRQALIKEVLRRAAKRMRIVDLNRATSLDFFLSELGPESDLTGVVVNLGDLEARELSTAQVQLAVRVITQRGGCVLSSALGAPEHAEHVIHLQGAGQDSLRSILAFFDVFAADKVQEMIRGAGGLPGRLVVRLGETLTSDPRQEESLLYRILSFLPDGIPRQHLDKLPSEVLASLPGLVDSGAVRAVDEQIFVDRRVDALLSKSELNMTRQIVSSGEVYDPLWTALAAARLDLLDLSRDLLKRALFVAGARQSERRELCQLLVLHGHRPAVLPLAELHKNAGELDEAVSLLREHSNLSTQEASVLVGVLQRKRDYSEVIKICSARLADRREPEIVKIMLDSYFLQARYDELDLLLESYRDQLSELGPFEELNMRVRAARGRFRKGDDIQYAGALLEQVWEHRLSPDMPVTAITTASSLCRLYSSDLERAGELLNIGIERVDKIGDRRNASGLRLNLSNLLYNSLGKAAEARKVALKAYSIAKELDARNLKMPLCYTLFFLEFDAGRLPDARRWARRFLEQSDAIKAPPVVARRCSVLARLAALDTQPEQGLEILAQIPEGSTDPMFQSGIDLYKAELLISMSRHSEALSTLNGCRDSGDFFFEAKLKSLRGRARIGLARVDLREARELVPDNIDLGYRMQVGGVLLASAGEDLDLNAVEQRSKDLGKAANFLRGDQAAYAASLREWLDGARAIELDAITELTNAIREPRDLPGALVRLVRRAMGANRVLIMMTLPGMGQQVSSNNLYGAEAAGITDEIGRRIKTPSDYWLAEDAFSDPHLRKTSRTVRTFELKSLVAVPIPFEGRAIGALYVDDKYRAGRFGMDEVKVLRRLAASVGALSPVIKHRGSKKTIQDLEDIYGLRTNDERVVENMRQTISMVQRERESNLLITGETGTGKSVLARRLARDLLGCSGLEVVVLRKADPNMLVTQLVGSRRGEFTGAMNQEGAIQRAMQNNRALFLDEIQNVGEDGQQLLLPLLEIPRHFGGLTRSSVPLDAPLHIILATNVEIDHGKWEKHFRHDLWYRMSAMHLHLPPVRERGVEAVYRYLADIFSEIEGVPSVPEKVLSPAALLHVTSWDWPGNLRQLRAFAFQAAHRYKMMGDQQIPKHALPRLGLTESVVVQSGDAVQAMTVKDQERVQVERMLEALRRNDWVQKRAADTLGMRPANFSKLLKRYGLREQVKQRRRAAREDHSVPPK